MSKKIFFSSLTMAIGLALGTLLYDWVAHRDELAEDFPGKYLVMFATMFVLLLIVKSVISSLRAKSGDASTNDALI